MKLCLAMTVSLDLYLSRLERRFSLAEAACRRFYLVRRGARTIDRSAMQEGLVSFVWQAWNGFCRDIIVVSASGKALTKAGAVISSPHDQRSEAEICYIAREFSNRRRPSKIRAIIGQHEEPTWGDLGKINYILGYLNTSNANTMATAIGSITLASDLRIVRNACAHIGPDRVSEVRAMAVRYEDSAFVHPSDAIIWIDRTTRDFSILAWIEEMRVASRAAVS